METPSKKGHGANRDNILSRNAFIHNPQKTNRILMMMMIVLAVVVLATLIIKFKYIKKSLSPNIQMAQFVASHETASTQDVSFHDKADANKQTILASDDTLYPSENDELNSVLLTTESEIRDQSQGASYEDSHSVENIKDVITKDDTQPQRLSRDEGTLQDNNLQETIIFNYDSDVISPLFYSNIEKIVDVLLRDSESFVMVEGHTDNIGSETYNINLSMRRALAVTKILIQKGIDTERIKIAYLAYASPVSSNSTESGRRSNRRVEMRVVSDTL